MSKSLDEKEWRRAQYIDYGKIEEEQDRREIVRSLAKTAETVKAKDSHVPRRQRRGFGVPKYRRGR